MYPIVFEVKHIFKDDGFHSKLFDAAVANYFDLNNPIRFNNFCYALRELIREKLITTSPDDEVKKCVWYDKNQKNVTRVDRIRFLIMNGLSNDVVDAEMIKQVLVSSNKLKKHINTLSKYTHITQKSIQIDFYDGDKLFEDVLKQIKECFELIEKVRKQVLDQIIDEAQNDIEDALIVELPSEIEELSTHSTIDSVIDVSISIENIDCNSIHFTGSGSVEVELQYGSNSDLRNDNGATDNKNFPFKFKFTTSVENLSDREYCIDEIDTSSYYED